MNGEDAPLPSATPQSHTQNMVMRTTKMPSKSHRRLRRLKLRSHSAPVSLMTMHKKTGCRSRMRIQPGRLTPLRGVNPVAPLVLSRSSRNDLKSNMHVVKESLNLRFKRSDENFFNFLSFFTFSVVYCRLKESQLNAEFVPNRCYCVIGESVMCGIPFCVMLVLQLRFGGLT